MLQWQRSKLSRYTSLDAWLMLSRFITNRIDRFHPFNLSITINRRAAHTQDFAVPRESQSQFPLSGEDRNASQRRAWFWRFRILSGALIVA
jgi:hypothetical protein